MGMRSVCVFCGARLGNDPAFEVVARDAARALAERGLGLVYGGGNIGMMGVLADEALRLGVQVTGVIPRSMVDVELAHRGVQRLIVVGSMHERKAVMARECDGILTLPGGVGTLDELFEAMTWNQLKLQRKPIGIVDVVVGGSTYYEGLLGFLRGAMAQGLVLPKTLELMVVGAQCGEVVDAMAGVWERGGGV